MDLCVNKAIYLESVQRALSRCHSLVAVFNRSWKKYQDLHEKQIQLGLEHDIRCCNYVGVNISNDRQDFRTAARLVLFWLMIVRHANRPRSFKFGNSSFSVEATVNVH